MEMFVQGQRLTASQLNSAFEKVGGPMNPSNDYQWTKTDYGNLQTTWNTFIQSKNQNPNPLEIGIGYSTIGNERVVEVDGKKPDGLRRVFVNVGQMMQMKIPGTSFSDCPNIGDVNGTPLIGICGWNVHPSQNSYMPGDDQMHFSIWSPALSKGITPQQWEANQKLWQDNVVRGCDSRYWWWTGITLDRHLPASDRELDICCLPLFLHYKDKSSEHPNWSTNSFAILMLILRRDLDGMVNNIPAGFADQFYTALTQAYPYDQLTVSEVSIGNQPQYITCLGQYLYSTTTQNAYYKTNMSYVQFRGESSPWRFASYLPSNSVFDPNTPLSYTPQWIDEDGKHISKSNTWATPVMKMDGTPIQEGDTIRHSALACAYNPKTMKEPVLSCVSYDNGEIFSTGNPAQAILSGLFNDPSYGLSSDIQKRLIWLNTMNARGVQYYDTCPDFRSGGGKINISAWDGHEIDTADNVSNLVLSSRADSRVEWDLVDLSGKWRIDCGVYYV